MSQINLCQDFTSRLVSLFECSPHGQYQRIRTPYLYPDGDNIDVFCRHQEQIILVSDLGETMRWLRMQTTSPNRSPKQESLIADACLNHGVELYRGMIQARCSPSDNLAAVVTRVAQAALRVSDLWFTFRTRAIETTPDEVADFLTERNIEFTRGEKLAGRSTRIWTPDFHVRTAVQSSLVYVLNTGSRSAAKAMVNHVHTAFYDLNNWSAGPSALKFISLFDDNSDVWSDEDFNLADQVSSVAFWSRPDDFEKKLKAA